MGCLHARRLGEWPEQQLKQADARQQDLAAQAGGNTPNRDRGRHQGVRHIGRVVHTVQSPRAAKSIDVAES